MRVWFASSGILGPFGVGGMLWACLWIFLVIVWERSLAAPRKGLRVSAHRPRPTTR